MLSRYTDSQSVYESASTTRRWVTPGSPEVGEGADGMTRAGKGFGAGNISILRYAGGLQPVWPAPIPSASSLEGAWRRAPTPRPGSGVRIRGAGARAPWRRVLTKR